MAGSLGQALVTGGAQRLGRYIALELARAGYDIALHCRRSREQADLTAAQVRELGVNCEVFQSDLSDPSQVSALMQACLAVGPVTCLVNNASLFEFDSPAEFSTELFDQHMAVNLRAPLQLINELHKVVPEGQTAVVVNLLDQKLQNMNPDFLSYTLSKAGLDAATTALAMGLAPKLRVVGVAPGLTMISHLQTQEQFEKTHSISPIKRPSEPQDVANAVRFLVQSPAVTGTTLLVDGGQHLVPMARDFSMMTQ